MRYRQHEKYDPHMDVYDPAEYGPQTTMRMATVIVYLADADGGGETAFMREGKDGECEAHPCCSCFAWGWTVFVVPG
jgi:prolyl 4-hydroxylase